MGAKTTGGRPHTELFGYCHTASGMISHDGDASLNHIINEDERWVHITKNLEVNIRALSVITQT
jgi:hypothetical protein